MKIKSKLRLGFGFLFLVVIFFGAISLFYMNDISKNAKVILEDNYESLSFIREMRTVLDEHTLPLSDEAKNAFEQQLIKEENNITELGERKEVAELRGAFNELITTSPAAGIRVRKHLRTIDQINMAAIVRKNVAAQASVKRATLLLGLTAAFTFMILFSFVVNFPGFVADPLRETLAGIKEISRGNYHKRLEFKGGEEFSELAAAFNEMAKKLNEWEHSNLAGVISEKMRIEALIEQMQDAIIGLNEKQEILFINVVAEQLLNLDAKKVTGKNATAITDNNDLLKYVLNGTNQDKTMKVFANGKESYFHLDKRDIVIPNYGDDTDSGIIKSQKSAGTVYMLRNVTQFKELDEAKTNFIATVSHELKTPISSIKMSLKLLSDDRVGTMNKEQSDLITHIGDDTNRLLKITSELLDLSQVETGNLQLNFVQADPDEIVNYSIEAVKFQAGQKNIQLDIVSQENLPKVYADLEKTAWVLINFLSNALRYSAEKSRVVIQVIQAGKSIEFSVRDFGKGIDEQYKRKLFDRYFQVPTDGTNKSGSGLGLAISKDFIEAHSGKIWVESAIGEGSRFCFSLPVLEENFAI